MNKKTVSQWIEEMVAAEIVAFKVRVGSSSNPTVIGVVSLESHWEKMRSKFPSQTVIPCELEEIDSAVEEMAADAGWMTEHPTIRIHAVKAGGANGPTYASTNRNATPSGTVEGASAFAIRELTNAVLKSNNVLVRSVDILTETIAHSKETEEFAAERYLEAREGQLSAEAETMATEMIAAVEASETSDNGLAQAGIQALQQIAVALAPAVAASTTAGGDLVTQLKQKLRSDPALLMQVASDPEVIELVLSAAGGGETTRNGVEGVLSGDAED